MNITKLASGFLLAAATVAAGCAGTATYSTGGYATEGYSDASLVYDAPPPVRVVVAPAPRIGFVYIQGRWLRANNRWMWRDGMWERERVGYSYAPGAWQRRPRGGYLWVGGRWSGNNRPNRGRVIVR